MKRCGASRSDIPGQPLTAFGTVTATVMISPEIQGVASGVDAATSALRLWPQTGSAVTAATDPPEDLQALDQKGFCTMARQLQKSCGLRRKSSPDAQDSEWGARPAVRSQRYARSVVPFCLLRGAHAGTAHGLRGPRHVGQLLERVGGADLNEEHASLRWGRHGSKHGHGRTVLHRDAARDRRASRSDPHVQRA